MKIDLKEWIAKVIGQTEFRTLLWENTGSTLGAETISDLPLDEYDAVEVYATFFGVNSPTDVGGFFKAGVGGSGLIQLTSLDTTNATNASTFINAVARTFQVTSSSVIFGNGQMTYAGGAYVNWNSRAVPLRIYGIKYLGGGTT